MIDIKVLIFIFLLTFRKLLKTFPKIPSFNFLIPIKNPTFELFNFSVEFIHQ